MAVPAKVVDYPGEGRVIVELCLEPYAEGNVENLLDDALSPGDYVLVTMGYVTAKLSKEGAESQVEVHYRCRSTEELDEMCRSAFVPLAI